MNDWLLQLIAHFGAPVLGLVTFASCLALPVPASLLMLAAGAFAAAGDLSLGALWLLALAGAILGDQTGFRLGQLASDPIDAALADRPKRRALYIRAKAYLRANGSRGIFLTRWLFSPLGPYANFAAGASRLGWARFSAAAAAGEVIWVSMYLALGYAFARNLAMAADLAGQVIGFLAASGAALFLGRWLLRLTRKRAAARPRPEA
ncbi:DedA family protein [Rhodobacteraceae bacterium 63075]|nr:DedA family protein [Rhodobacteraceae bacterium 63075]